MTSNDRSNKKTHPLGTTEGDEQTQSNSTASEQVLPAFVVFLPSVA
jgi:hypothetical protein